MDIFYCAACCADNVMMVCVRGDFVIRFSITEMNFFDDSCNGERIKISV